MLERRKWNKRGQDHFAVIGERGAIEFHYFLDSVGSGHLTGGVETHSRQPRDYDRPEPHFDKCWTLNGPCWTDGSSLWAEEYWIPMFLALGEPWVWERLEERYEDQFGKEA